MKSLLCAVTVAVILTLPSVYAAVCTSDTDYKCESTEFTLETCNANTRVCECKNGYLPVPSGCAAKPVTPNVALESGRVGIVPSGQNAVLTCSTIDTADGGYTLQFEWRKDGGNTNVTTQTYTITNATSSNVGSFSCKVKFVSRDGNLESDYSNPVQVTLLRNDSSFTPDMNGIPKSAAINATLKPACTDIPYGVTYKFQLSNNQPFQPPYLFTSAMVGLTVTCVLDSVPGVAFAVSTSQPKQMPTVLNGSIPVEIRTSPGGSDLTFHTDTKNILVTCLVETSNLDPAKQINYTFFDSNNKSPEAKGNNYTVTPANGVHTINCSAAYDGMTNSSQSVTITFSDTYLPAPLLHTEETGNSVHAGSRLVLTCGDSQNQVKYTWTKDNQVIFRQYDRTIQFGSAADSDKGTYSCQARRNNYIVQSNSLTITVTSHAMAAISSIFLLAGAAFISLLV